MTELQQARADWLNAESRIVDLQRENQRLLQQNHELQMNLISMQCRATIAEAMSVGFAQTMLTV